MNVLTYDEQQMFANFNVLNSLQDKINFLKSSNLSDNLIKYIVLSEPRDKLELALSLNIEQQIKLLDSNVLPINSMTDLIINSTDENREILLSSLNKNQKIHILQSDKLNDDLILNIIQSSQIIKQELILSLSMQQKIRLVKKQPSIKDTLIAELIVFSKSEVVQRAIISTLSINQKISLVNLIEFPTKLIILVLFESMYKGTELKEIVAYLSSSLKKLILQSASPDELPTLEKIFRENYRYEYFGVL